MNLSLSHRGFSLSPPLPPTLSQSQPSNYPGGRINSNSNSRPTAGRGFAERLLGSWRTALRSGRRLAPPQWRSFQGSRPAGREAAGAAAKLGAAGCWGSCRPARRQGSAGAGRRLLPEAVPEPWPEQASGLLAQRLAGFDGGDPRPRPLAHLGPGFRRRGGRGVRPGTRPSPRGFCSPLEPPPPPPLSHSSLKPASRAPSCVPLTRHTARGRL